MTPQLKLLLIPITVWHLTCLIVMFIYGHTVAHIVVAAYSAWFGDIQASYTAFARLTTYVAIVTITSPATFISLLVFDGLVRRQPRAKQILVAFFAWQLLAVAILIWSLESSFPYILNQLAWSLFGPPEDIYGFRNLVLHRVIAWLLCTTPVAVVILCRYSEANWRVSLRALLFGTTLVAVLLGILFAVR